MGTTMMDECEMEKWEDGVHSGVMEEKAKPRDLYSVEKSALAGGEAQADMRRTWLCLLPKAMSLSIILLKLRSVSLSVAQVTTKGQADVCSLGCCQKPCESLRGMLLKGTC